MSIRIQNLVWRLDLSPSLKYVAIALADHAHDDGTEARPTQAYMANKTGLTERSIRRALRELLDLGVIEKQRLGGRNRATTYRFVIEDTSDHLSKVERRTFDSDRRTNTTVKADTSDRLTIRTIIYNQEETTEEIVSDDERASHVIASRRALRERHSKTL